MWRYLRSLLIGAIIGLPMGWFWWSFTHQDQPLMPLKHQGPEHLVRHAHIVDHAKQLMACNDCGLLFTPVTVEQVNLWWILDMRWREDHPLQ